MIWASVSILTLTWSSLSGVFPGLGTRADSFFISSPNGMVVGRLSLLATVWKRLVMRALVVPKRVTHMVPRSKERGSVEEEEGASTIRW